MNNYRKQTTEQLKGMSIQEIISFFRAEKAGEDRILFKVPNGVQKDMAVSVMRARKPEILDYFAKIEAEEKRKYDERNSKIKMIPGLEELDFAYEDLAKWNDEFRKSFDGESGVGVRKRPEYDFETLEANYPAAAAYIAARNEARKSNYEISAYGKEAMRMIEDDPERYLEALDYMESERKAFVDRHAWD